jgi:hypothetical protein
MQRFSVLKLVVHIVTILYRVTSSKLEDAVALLINIRDVPGWNFD